MAYIIDVVPTTHVPRPHPGIFSYRAHASLPRGAVAEVSFGRRNVLGVVVQSGKDLGTKRKLKSVLRVISSHPLLSPQVLQYLEWESRATLTPLGSLLSRAMPALVRKHEWKQEPLASQRSHPRKSVADYIDREDRIRFERYKRELLHTWQKDGQALLVVPTRAMQHEALIKLGKHRSVVAAPFGQTRFAQELWKRIRRGEPLIVVGTASAVRLPFSRLRLVILDDAANQLYKETRSHPYSDARIGVRVLAELHGARFLFGGLVPPLSYVSGALQKKAPAARRLRVEPRTVPLRGTGAWVKTVLVDLKNDRPRDGLSRTLEGAIREIGEKKKDARALLFVNRRGSAPALACADCGFVFACTHCDVSVPVFRVPQNNADRTQKHAETRPRLSTSSLRESAAGAELRCRHCGRNFIPPLVCPSCRGFRLVPRGAASQQLEETLKKKLPDMWVGRLDTDSARRPRDQERIVKALRFVKNPILLIGTAMVLNRPLPSFDLVGIPAADQLFAIPDMGVEEEAFGILARLRAMLKPKGTLIAQTWHPENQIFHDVFSGDFRAFAKRELLLRKKFHLPPYRRLAKLTYSHRDSEKASAEATRLAENLNKFLSPIPYPLSPEIIGSYPAFIPRVRGKYIWHILIKWKPGNENNLRMEDRLWEFVPSNWDIDVNPISIL